MGAFQVLIVLSLGTLSASLSEVGCTSSSERPRVVSPRPLCCLGESKGKHLYARRLATLCIAALPLLSAGCGGGDSSAREPAATPGGAGDSTVRGSETTRTKAQLSTKAKDQPVDSSGGQEGEGRRSKQEMAQGTGSSGSVTRRDSPRSKPHESQAESRRDAQASSPQPGSKSQQQPSSDR